MWFERKNSRQLTRDLRALRQESPRALVEEISAQVTPRHRRAWSRAAFAGALATLVLGTFASFGGVGYAASETAATVKTVYSVSKTASAKTSAHDQYSHHSVVVNVAPKHSTVVHSAKPTTPTVTAKTLPFTGLSLKLTAAAAFALMLLGFGLRSWEKRSS